MSNIYKGGALLFFALIAEFVYAAADRLVFITSPQSIEPGVLSEVLTVQVQSNSGEAEKVGETFDIQFTSSSATGEFLNSGGQPVSTVMAKNSSNRNFYYRDSAVGQHAITVVITGRESGAVLEAAQMIGVGVSVDGTASADSETGDDIVAAKRSAHHSPEELTTLEARENIKIGAGRPRVVAVNAPVWFKAAVTGTSAKAKVSWSFGDGGSRRGRSVQYVYRWPGTYTVVATVRDGESEISSRTTVEVFEPSIRLVTDQRGAVVLNNQSNYEINLGGWSVEYDHRRAMFASNTIVPPGGQLPIMFGPVASVQVHDNDERLIAEWRALDQELLARAKALVQSEAVRPVAASPQITAVPPPIVLASSSASVAVASSVPATIILSKPVGFWERSMLLLRKLKNK